MKNRFSPPSSRSRLGLTLEELAPFIGVSTSLLSMSEMNQRYLSGMAGIKATGIDLCIYRQTEAAVIDTLVDQLDIFKERYGQCLIQKERVETRLQKLKEKEACLLNLIKVSDELPGILTRLMPDYQLTEFEVKWLKDYGKISRSKLKTCGKAQQQLLQVQIDALLHEMELLQPLFREDV